MAVRYQIAGRGAAAISASIEAGIRTGALAPGTLLPPVRTLAADLVVAAATVASAYRELRQRGMVETAGRNGTRVRLRPPVTTRVAPRVAVPPGTVDLASGEPDRSLQPALGPLLIELGASIGPPVSYAESGVWPALAEQAADRLRADGVPAQSVAVTSGALDAMERLLTAHLRPGDRIAVEDPGWANLIDLVAALALEAVPLPVDDEGPTVDGLQRTIAEGAAAVVVTSRAQNPTGGAVSPERAAALRPILAGAPELLCIEDDHAAELANVSLAPLAGAAGRWAFVRSASKPYGADLRLAVVTGDDATIARMHGRMRLGAGWVSTVLQRLLLRMWSDPTVAAQVAAARVEYDHRRDALRAALAQRGVTAYGRTGINVWIPVEHESAALTALLDRHWAVSPGSLYRQRSGPGIRVTVGALMVDQVEPLAEAISAVLTPGSGRGTSR